MAAYTIEPADALFDAAMIRRDGKCLLITGISSDHASEHNRLAEALVKILSRPEIDAEIALLLGERPDLEAVVSGHEDRWNQGVLP